MRRINIVIVFCFVGVIQLLAQEKLQIDIVNILDQKQNLLFDLRIKNITKDTIFTYFPSINDVCCNILTFDFEKKNSRKKNLFFPCDLIVDLGCITLDSSNTIKVYPLDSLNFKYVIKKNRIRPRLENGVYYISIGWQLKDVCFLSEERNCYIENIYSKKYSFLYNCKSAIKNSK